jgi:hypothetical protein
MAFKTNNKETGSSRLRLRQEIRLLSGGYTNRAAFPGGKITVYPWDVDIDAWATERAQRALKTFMWDLAARVCDLNNCPIEKMVVGDISTILLISRAIAHKNVVRYSAKCPGCGQFHQDQIRVPDELEKIAEKKDDYVGYDIITLPDSTDKVAIRPLEVGDLMKIDGRQDDVKKQVSDRMCRILVPIVTINDGTADMLEQLIEWYDALSPADKKFLTDSEDNLYPHLNTSLEYKCDECDEVFTFPLVFDEKFFRDSRA